MVRTDLDVLLETARTSALALGGDKINFRTAHHVIRTLVEEKMPPEDLLARVYFSRHRNRLFLALMMYLESGQTKNKWLEFEDAVVTNPSYWQHDTTQGIFGKDTLVCFFARVSNLRRLLVQHCHVLLDEGLPYYAAMSADKYWEERVGRFVCSHDRMRAWDELIKAVQGIRREAPINTFCFQASSALVTRLTYDLYSKSHWLVYFAHPHNIGNNSVFPISGVFKDSADAQRIVQFLKKVDRDRQIFIFKAPDCPETLLSRVGVHFAVMAYYFRQEKNRRSNFRKVRKSLAKKR